MNHDHFHFRLHPESEASPPERPDEHDPLDNLLREWHRTNAARAAAGRDRLLHSLANPAVTTEPKPTRTPSITIRRLAWRLAVPLAAAAAVALVVVPFLRPPRQSGFTESAALAVSAPAVIMAPDAARLDAFDVRGNLLGPCILKNTELRAAVTGPLAHVTIAQQFENPLNRPIDAVYTLPLGPGGVVDSLELVIGERIIIGEAIGADQASDALSSARAHAQTAASMSKQSSSVFTQTIVNVPPRQEVTLKVSYVNPVERRTDGDFELALPTAIGPRYAAMDPEPVSGGGTPQPVPEGFRRRGGVVLLGPAHLANADSAANKADISLDAALAVEPVSPDVALGEPVARLSASYGDGLRERVELFKGGIGRIGDRWFAAPDSSSEPTRPTMPPRPSHRESAGLSVRVDLDTGGPGMVSLESPQHPVTRQDTRIRSDGLASAATVVLSAGSTIVNEDFKLRWRLSLPEIAAGIASDADARGQFVAISLTAPNTDRARDVLPRRVALTIDPLVLHSAETLEQGRRLLAEVGSSLHQQDVINVTTTDASGAGLSLWSEARTVTTESVTAASTWLAARATKSPAGPAHWNAVVAAAGTLRESESVDAPIDIAALDQLDPDGREVHVRVPETSLISDGLTNDAELRNGRLLLSRSGDGEPVPVARVERLRLPKTYLPAAGKAGPEQALGFAVRGRWILRGSERVLSVDSATVIDVETVQPVSTRIIFASPESHSLRALGAALRTSGASRDTIIAVFGPVDRTLAAELRATARAVVTVESPETSSTMLAAKAVVDAIGRPILQHIRLSADGPLLGADFEPPLDQVPELRASESLVLLARVPELATGDITVSGQTAAGPWSQTIRLEKRSTTAQPLGLASAWAAARVERTADWPELASSVATTYGIVTPLTSYLAVDHRKVVVDGETALVPVPIERGDPDRWDQLGAPGAPQATPTPAARGELVIRTPSDESERESAAARGRSFGANISKKEIDRESSDRGVSVDRVQAPSQSPQTRVAEERALPSGRAPAADPVLASKPASASKSARTEADSSAPLAPAPGANSANFTPLQTQGSAAGDQNPSMRDADAYFASVVARLESAQNAGRLPAERLAAAAGANFIAQSAKAGRFDTAERARALFLGRFGEDPLLNEVAAAINPTLADSDAVIEAKPREPSPPPPAGGPARDDQAALRSPRRSGLAQAKDDAGTVNKLQGQAGNVVEALAARAEQAVERETQLSRRLDPRLYELIAAASASHYTQMQNSTFRQYLGNSSQQRVYGQPQQAAGASNRAMYQRASGDLLVSVLVDVLDQTTLQALTAAGLALRSTLPEERVVVGTASAQTLEAIAMVEGVRRVEPAKAGEP